MKGRKAAPLRKRRESEFWHKLTRVVWILIAFGVLALVVTFFYPAVNELHVYREKVETKQSELEAAKKLNAEQNEKLHLLQTDPEYVETIARDRLDLMKEGETIFRLDGSNNQN